MKNIVGHVVHCKIRPGKDYVEVEKGHAAWARQTTEFFKENHKRVGIRGYPTIWLQFRRGDTCSLLTSMK
jgi:hypothetical protein